MSTSYSESNATQGDYVELSVSNFNGGSETVGQYSDYNMQLRSYLRLGAVSNAVYNTYSGGGTYSSVSDTGEDLASRVTSYVDDDRERGGSGAPYYRLNSQERKTESNALHTRGGWRDHTDGNRITTTYGDKVEVIGGNHKLIVMGRRQWTSGNDSDDASLHWESSGGITYHYDQIPGQINDVSWVPDMDGVFRVKEECLKGHFVERVAGYEREWAFGPKIETRIGSKDAYETAVALKDNAKYTSAVAVPTSPHVNYDNRNDGSGSYNSTTYYDVDDDYDYDPLALSAGGEAHKTGVWPPASAELPDIWETTWANSITVFEWALTSSDYTGDHTRKVPNVEHETHVKTMYSYDSAHRIIEETHFKTRHRTDLIADSGGTFVEVRGGRFAGYSDGRAGEYWGQGKSKGGGSLVTNFFEFFFGGFESIRMGSSVTFFFGLAADMHVAFPLGIAWDIYLLCVAAEVNVLTQQLALYGPGSYHGEYKMIDHELKWTEVGTGLSTGVMSVAHFLGTSPFHLLAIPFAVIAAYGAVEACIAIDDAVKNEDKGATI